MTFPFRRMAALTLAGLACAAASAGQTPDSPKRAPARHNVIIFVTDGLRAGSVNPADAPALAALRREGVSFPDSHSLFPTFTTPNASAIATGHFLGDTGDFSNTLFVGYPIFNTGSFGNPPGTNTPFIENDAVLSDIDDHFGGNYLDEETLLAYARTHGYSTAAVGKQGPTLIQDVTQGNRDAVTGAVPPPITVILDDSTGKPGGVPLSGEVTAALTNAGLALVAPSRSNGASATAQGSNGFSGTNAAPGTLAPNTVQQRYFADAVTKAILPAFRAGGRPFVLVFWSRDPDGTQHNQGDSLNRLTPGINGPTSRAAIGNVDSNLAQIRAALRALKLDGSTDLFVTADHGFNTISKHELDSRGTVTKSYAAGFVYKDAAGRQEVNAGFLPSGFLAIDLAHALNLPLFDPDSQIPAGAPTAYKPVDPTIPQATETVNQRPAFGDGLLGGTGARARPTDAQVVVAANGGSDLLYLPTGTRTERVALARRIVDFLSRQDYVSGLFADDVLGPLPGALPLSDIHLKGSAVLPTPSLVVNFRSFHVGAGNPLLGGVVIADTGLQEGQGMHGSFDRSDTFNFMAAVGPDFKRGFVDPDPTSNADVPLTLAHVLGFRLPARGRLRGRVLSESLRGGPASLPHTPGVPLRSAPAANGQRTVLRFQKAGGETYFDAAGFPGRTNGL